MNYDEILEHLGETGLWQWVMLALLWLPPMCAGMFVLQYSFTGLEPDEYRCVIPGCDGPDALYDDYAPEDIHPMDGGDLDYCKYFRPTAVSFNGTCIFGANGTDDVVSCGSGAEFLFPEDFEFESTLVTEENLYCSRGFMVALVGSIYMAGLLVSSFICGFLSDKIGRKPTIVLAILVSCIGGIGNAFCYDYYSFAVCRFIAAVGGTGMFMVPFGLSVELVGSKMKTLVGNAIQIPFAIGEVIVSLIAMGVRDWRWFELASTLPVLSLLLLWFVIPESPRWLIATGKYKEARKTIEQAARWNKVSIPEYLLQPPTSKEKETGKAEEAPKAPAQEHLGFRAMFSTRMLTKNTLIMFANWIIVTLGYYGISLSSGDLSSDIFVNFILISLVEIPSYIFCLLIMDHVGRKPLFVFALLLTGIFCVVSGFLPESTFKMIFALIGKFGAAAAFSIVYLYTAELYPTEIRGTVVGMCSMFARLGGIAAPQVALYLPQVTNDAVPMVLMGSAAGVGAFISLFLPETLGAPLMESLSEVAELSSKTKPFFRWWSTATLKRHMQEQIKEIEKKEGHLTN